MSENHVEKVTEDEIVAWAIAHGGEAVKLKIAGKKGWPDRTVLLPGGVIVFPEVKRPKGNKASPQQEWWIARLKELGFQAEVVRSVAEVEAMVKRAKSQR